MPLPLQLFMLTSVYWCHDFFSYYLKSLDVDAIFVLGYPKYYGMRGFYPTYVALPYQTEVKRIDAWKMRELKPGSMAEVGGTSVACNAIMKPMFWDLNYEPRS